MSTFENEERERILESGSAFALPRWQQVRASEPPKRRPTLVAGILRRGHVALISGKAKSGKSWLALNLSVCVACGISWLGRECA